MLCQKIVNCINYGNKLFKKKGTKTVILPNYKQEDTVLEENLKTN